MVAVVGHCLARGYRQEAHTARVAAPKDSLFRPETQRLPARRCTAEKLSERARVYVEGLVMRLGNHGLVQRARTLVRAPCPKPPRQEALQA